MFIRLRSQQHFRKEIRLLAFNLLEKSSAPFSEPGIHNNGRIDGTNKNGTQNRDDKNGTFFSSELRSFKEFLDSVKDFFLNFLS
jgi:hypothetical protein